MHFKLLDSSAKEIAEEILNNLSEESEPRGMILIKEVSNAYEIGTKKKRRFDINQSVDLSERS